MTAPPGYERLLLAHAVAVARSDVLAAFRKALLGADGTPSTLHAFAAIQPAARALAGRGTAWAIALPGGPRVVVRHNRHGGVFARLTGDRFFSPTRAPYELEVSMALRERGIRTPEVIGYALYPPGAVMQRADVVSVEIPQARDLAEVLGAVDDERRSPALEATARLVAALSRAGAQHADLNARNILVDATGAHVLDVDRVRLDVDARSALAANLARLARSLRKWRTRFGVHVPEADIAGIERDARHAMHGD